MKCLALIALSFFLTASHCNSSKRLTEVFASHPETHFFVLQHLSLLPNIHDYAYSKRHLRLFANYGDADAQALLAEFYKHNDRLYQSSLIAAGGAGSLLARDNIEDYLINTKQWLKVLDLPWQIKQKTRTLAHMALRRPIAKHAVEYQLNYGDMTCKQQVMVVATDLKSYLAAQQLITEFNAHYQLPICLSRPVYFDQQKLTCSQNDNKPIHCEFNNKQELTTYQFDKMIILAEQGIANADSQSVRMRYNQSYKVLLHELMHLYGFIDEYPLKQALATRLCNVRSVTQIAKNIVVLPVDSQAKSQIRYKGKIWHKTRTCDRAKGTAYKPIMQTTNLEILDLSVPDLYMTWLKQAVM